MRIADLIQKVRAGELRVPRFPRGFVWSRNQVIELLGSVRKRYPIGTLFVWRTSERYSSFDHIGKVPMPKDVPREPAMIGYVLDGHQRVSCLVGVLGLTDQEAMSLHGADLTFLVHYDLEQGRFVHVAHPSDVQLPARYLLPVGASAASDPLTDWLDQRRDKFEAGTEVKRIWDRYRRDALALQTTFGQYVLRYDDVTDASLAEAIDIYRLLNRQGTPARAEDVFAALSWQPGGFDFVEQAKAALAGLRGFESLNTSVVLRALMCSLGLSVNERDWVRIQTRHAYELPAAAERVGVALSKAADFLQEVGARHANVVPYALQVVLLTRFYELQPEPDAQQRNELERWFWASSYGAVYGGAGSLALDEHLSRATDLARGVHTSILPTKPRMQPLPRRFHPRSSRVRAFHLFLATLDPLDPETGKPTKDPLARGFADVPAAVESNADDAWMLGARVLLGPGRGRAKDRLLKARTRANFPEILASHAITLEAFDLLERGDDKGFIEARHQHLAALEREHARQFVDVGADGEEEVYDEPEIDLDEEGDSAS
jgi:hypothetical protein